MRPSVVRSVLLIAVVKARLRLFGVQPTLVWMLAGKHLPANGEANAPRLVALARDAVQTAAALFPGRALCLEQSIALAYLLRRAGVMVALRFGVKPHPFEAHAWVEYAGEPINDFPEHVGYFTAMPPVST